MKIIGQANLAAELGCSAVVVYKWCKEGMPFEIEGFSNYIFDKDECIAWVRAKSPRHKRWMDIRQNKIANGLK